ncbi:SDR family NAD(P)-dependent oxidoreductase [Modestobacter sp. VKM Ac-2979]|uniref:SDR family NAD(P)-dependent oxidoreductase n=1 Tax=unclassified Modestobacter TaxID=2643866 RepID=UPI0022AB7209|nr:MULTISPECIES: SDR family oxidoreductase [unclassified Modestobacter]MCZ2811650.1 SDR family NAD(P)-dependent oxidoreductase [Modestobacter sp. VKM Ac-2979]MCZ2843373.1 SDR family NAD(P)-dependent oxidoreductase [Modestobacter sp. VKM Ac-2980]
MTGGGSGIGAASAAALAADGWDVVICGRREAALRTVADQTGAHPVVADMDRPANIRALVAAAVERYGRLDGLVLNAGIVLPGPVGDLTDEDWEAMVSTNLTGPFLLTREALPHLLAVRGAIVGVASAAALRATAGIAGYDATKAGLAMLMQSVAVDYGPMGVRANAVCPGWTRTEMADMEMTEAGTSAGVDREEAYRLATAFVPSRRAAHAREVAEVIAWLLSPKASYVNAAVLPVDGGLVAVEPGAIGFDPRVAVGADAPAPVATP